MNDLTDTLKQFIESRVQEANLHKTYVPSHNLVRKLTPEQMDRLMSISPAGGRTQDFKW